jgi:hypothetical protein
MSECRQLRGCTPWSNNLLIAHSMHVEKSHGREVGSRKLGGSVWFDQSLVSEVLLRPAQGRRKHSGRTAEPHGVPMQRCSFGFSRWHTPYGSTQKLQGYQSRESGRAPQDDNSSPFADSHCRHPVVGVKTKGMHRCLFISPLPPKAPQPAPA